MPTPKCSSSVRRGPRLDVWFSQSVVQNTNTVSHDACTKDARRSSWDKDALCVPLWRLTKIEGKNSAPATCPTSLTAAKAGALAVRVVKAAAIATWLAFPFNLEAETTCLFLFETLMVHLALLELEDLRANLGILFEAHTTFMVFFKRCYSCFRGSLFRILFFSGLF